LAVAGDAFFAGVFTGDAFFTGAAFAGAAFSVVAGVAN